MKSVKRLLYSLKNRYGQPIDFYKEVDNPPNILTGRIIKSRIKHTIKKAIILNEKLDSQSLFLPKADQIALISGLIETNFTQILIDGTDFPKDFVPTLNDYVVSSGDKYTIDSIKYIDKNQAYYIFLKEFKGSQIPQIYNVNIHDKLTLIHLVKLP